MPFMSHDWLLCWIRAFGQDVALRIFLVWEGDELIAAAPCCIDTYHIMYLGVRRLRFTSSGVSPSCTFLVRKDKMSAIPELIRYIECLANDWNIAHFENVPDSFSSLIASNFKRDLTSEGRRSPVLNLDGTYDDYLSSRSANFRYDVRRAERAIKAESKLSFHRLDTPRLIAPRLHEVFRISECSWKRRLAAHIGASAASHCFYEELSKLNSKNAWSSIWLLLIDDEPAAMQWHIRNQRSTYLLRSDYDEKFKNGRPGHILQHRVIEDCFSLGIERYHFGGMDYEYKLRFTSDIESHSHLYCYNHRLLSQLLYLRHRLRRSASRSWRSVWGSILAPKFAPDMK
jgi:CelD/BcsL family acetyltransferase involved in cellulose biosynthesis